MRIPIRLRSTVMSDPVQPREIAAAWEPQLPGRRATRDIPDAIVEPHWGGARVVAALTPNNQYDLAQPQRAVIDGINVLYKCGHRIVLFTARGSSTGLDWVSMTQRQLADWGVLYHELRFGKPAADYYIDDRAVTLEQLPELVRRFV